MEKRSGRRRDGGNTCLKTFIDEDDDVLAVFLHNLFDPWRAGVEFGLGAFERGGDGHDGVFTKNNTQVSLY